MSRHAPSRFVILQRQPSTGRPLLWIALGLAWAGSMAGAFVLASQSAAPRLGATSAELASTRLQLHGAQRELRELRQRTATLTRSDQISRSANQEIQRTLARRDEEIAALRADTAFYERLVGATSQPKGLGVHSATFVPESGGTWRYEITLTQSLNRGAVSQGQLQIDVEGVRDGKLATIGWDELRQRRGAPPQGFSFRYFQQLEGSVMLPQGFTPQRVRVSLRDNDHAVVQTVGWQLASATRHVTATGET
jgi:hypothetical protein